MADSGTSYNPRAKRKLKSSQNQILDEPITKTNILDIVHIINVAPGSNRLRGVLSSSCRRTIQGRVIDAETKQALEGAVVIMVTVKTGS